MQNKITLPGEKDSMEAYVQDRAPEMAIQPLPVEDPFVFFPSKVA